MPNEPAGEIRPARPQDAATIRSLVRAARLNPFGLHWQRFYVVADENGTIGGCVQLKEHRRWHKQAVRELASLVVRPSWRGQGLGAALVRHLQRQAGPPLWLMCRSRLVTFYERSGFGEVVDRSEMPPAFAILQAGFDLARLGRRNSEYLAIMVWRG